MRSPFPCCPVIGEWSWKKIQIEKKNVIEIWKLQKTMKSMLSNKLVSSEKITLIENEKFLTDDKEIAKVLNDFFSDMNKSLNIS